MKQHPLSTLLGSGAAIVIHRSIIKIIGDIESAIFFEQLVYLLNQGESPAKIYEIKDGFLIMTRAAWSSQVFLADYAMRQIPTRLEKLGLIQIKKFRISIGDNLNNVIGFRPDLEKLNSLLEELAKIESGHPTFLGTLKSTNLGVLKSTNLYLDLDTNKKVITTAEIPEKLLSIKGFSETWAEWVEFRRTELKKPLTPTSIKKQFKTLFEDPDPIACLNNSMNGGYQGIFPSKKSYAQTNEAPRVRNELKPMIGDDSE